MTTISYIYQQEYQAKEEDRVYTSDIDEYDSRQKPSESNRKKPRLWTPLEDERLKTAISMFGTTKWTSVSEFVGNGRSQSQCSQRWTRGLNPDLRKVSWTKEEDDLLLHTIKELGTKSWTRIASIIPNRCDVQCRYRYQQLQKMSPITVPKKENVEDSFLLPSIWTLIQFNKTI